MSYPEGVDVSRYDETDYDWAAFYIVRLGSNVADDPRAAQHVGFARAHDIPLAAYWFLYEGQAGAAQADHAFVLMSKLDLVGHRIFADAEQPHDAATLTIATVRDFIARMKQLNGHCGLYSGIWIQERGGGTLGADYGWHPDYRNTPDFPADWSKDFLKLWQWTSTNGTLDRDRFLGTHEQMLAFFRTPKEADEMSFAEWQDGTEAFRAAIPLLDSWPGDKKKGWQFARWAGANPRPGDSLPPHEHVLKGKAV